MRAQGGARGSWALLGLALLACGGLALDEVRMFVELASREGVPSFYSSQLSEVRIGLRVVEAESRWTLRCELTDPRNVTTPLCPGADAQPQVCDEQPPTPPEGVEVRLRLGEPFSPWRVGMYQLLCVPNEVGSFSQRMVITFSVREGGPVPSPGEGPPPTPSPAPPAGPGAVPLMTPVPPRASPEPSPSAAPPAAPSASVGASPSPTPSPSWMAAPVCGDRVCQSGEDSSSCCRDCGCDPGKECAGGVCRPASEVSIECSPGRPCPNLRSLEGSIDTVLGSRLEVANEIALLESDGYRIVRPYALTPVSGYRFRVLAVKGERQVVIEGDIDAATSTVVSHRVIGEREEQGQLPEGSVVLAFALAVFVASYLLILSRQRPALAGSRASGEEQADLEAMGEVGSVARVAAMGAEGGAARPAAAAAAPAAALHAEVPPDWSESAGWQRHRHLASDREDALRTLESMAAASRELPPSQGAAAPEAEGAAPPPGRPLAREPEPSAERPVAQAPEPRPSQLPVRAVERPQPPAQAPPAPAPPAAAAPPAPSEPLSEDDEALIDSWLDDE